MRIQTSLRVSLTGSQPEGSLAQRCTLIFAAILAGGSAICGHAQQEPAAQSATLQPTGAPASPACDGAGITVTISIGVQP